MKRTEELIAAYLDNVLAAREVKELQNWLKADAANMQQFVLANVRDQQLRLAMASYRRPNEGRSADLLHRSTDKPAYRARIFLALAAVVAFVATVLVLLMPPTDQGPLATLSQVNGYVSWRNDVGASAESLKSGAHLTPGTLIIEGDSSLAEVVYTDGSRFVLTGSSEITLGANGGERLFLRYGALRANVSKRPEGQPLRIRTPTAEAVVLGTSFGISAAQAETFLRVDDGAVELRRLADNQAIIVAVDEQARASADTADTMSTEAVKAISDRWSADAHSLRGAEWLGEWQNPKLLAAQPRDVWIRQSESRETHFHAGVRNPLPGIVMLREDSVVRVRYRIGRHLNVGIFVSTFTTTGEFEGNYQSYIEARYTPADANGWREAQIPIKSFVPLHEWQSPFQPNSIAGTLFLTTFADDVGLEVAKLEVSSGSHR